MEKVVLVAIIQNEDELNNLFKSLNRMYSIILNIVCITNEKMYLKVRDRVFGRGNGKNLVICKDKTALNYTDSQPYLSSFEKVILLDNSTIFDELDIRRLFNASLIYPYCGYIVHTDYLNCLLCNDLYASEDEMSFKIISPDKSPIQPIDTISSGIIITSKANFTNPNFNCNNVKSFGIQLRQSGYQNYWSNINKEWQK